MTLGFILPCLSGADFSFSLPPFRSYSVFVSYRIVYFSSHASIKLFLLHGLFEVLLKIDMRSESRGCQSYSVNDRNCLHLYFIGGFFSFSLSPKSTAYLSLRRGIKDSVHRPPLAVSVPTGSAII